ncbi:MAG: hypothetical protein WCT40_01860 [Candidatus Magasanikbacteria bacterium]|jgi:hypothetical protein
MRAIKYKQFILTTIVMLGLIVPVLVWGAAPTPKDNLTKLGGEKSASLGLSNNLGEIAGTIVKGTLSVVGTIFFILIIYAGFLWMTAAGAEDKTESAQKIVTMAVIGLAIVMAAYAITVFVMGGFGVTISK